MSAVSPVGARSRREERARDEDGWRIWERASSRSPLSLHALHSALAAVTDSSDSSGDLEDGRMDDGDSERSGPDSQWAHETGGVKHARRPGAGAAQFDWQPSVHQFSEKLRREPNTIRFFDDDDTPEAAGILKLVDDDDEYVVGSAMKWGDGRLAQPGDPHGMPRGKAAPGAERSAGALPASPVYAPAPPAQPFKVPTSITEAMVKPASQPPHVPRSITEQFGRPGASPAPAPVPASITERFARPPPPPPPAPVHAPALPPGITMTIAQLIALAQQAVPSTHTMPPPVQPTSPPIQSISPPPPRPLVPASITEGLGSRPFIPASITEGIARRPVPSSVSSVSSGASTPANVPWLGYSSPSAQRSLSPASPPPTHAFAGYPPAPTTAQGYPNTYNNQQPQAWNSVSAPSAHSHAPAPGYQSPAAYHGTQHPAHSPPRHAGAYAQWPGAQYTVHRG